MQRFHVARLSLNQDNLLLVDSICNNCIRSAQLDGNMEPYTKKHNLGEP